jgi:hypothetical protein
MFSELPDYRVVLLGYSLGAGVVPLLALTLFQVLLVPHHSLFYGYSNLVALALLLLLDSSP